jgi:phage terminase Nu1 subunit (DNA packaging protein)
MSDDEKKGLMSTTQIAEVIGLTGERVRQLIKCGAITSYKRIGGDYYYSLAAVKQYIQYLRATHDEEMRGGMNNDLGEQRLAADVRIKNSKAKIVELEAAELEGKMHRAEEVEVVFNDLIYAVKSAIMAFPGRCAVNWAKAKTPARASAILEDEARNVLNELAEYKYDPDRMKDLARERMGKEQAESDDEQDEES